MSVPGVNSLLIISSLLSCTHTLFSFTRLNCTQLIFNHFRTISRCSTPSVSVWWRNRCCRGCTADWTSVRWRTLCPPPCGTTSRSCGSPSSRLLSPSLAPPSTVFWVLEGCSAPTPSQTASNCFTCSTRAGGSGGLWLHLTPLECPTRASPCSTTLFISSEETWTAMGFVPRVAAGGEITSHLFCVSECRHEPLNCIQAVFNLRQQLIFFKTNLLIIVVKCSLQL